MCQYHSQMSNQNSVIKIGIGGESLGNCLATQDLKYVLLVIESRNEGNHVRSLSLKKLYGNPIRFQVRPLHTIFSFPRKDEMSHSLVRRL